jgi:hypothetical protein
MAWRFGHAFLEQWDGGAGKASLTVAGGQSRTADAKIRSSAATGVD